MNCASCKKPVPVGASKCPACGAELKQEYSYDLLPDEPAAKTEEAGPSFTLPPGVEGSPAVTSEEKAPRLSRSDRPRGANAMAGGGGINLFKLGVGAGVLLILIVLGTKMCGSSVKITGPGNPGNKVETTFSTSNVFSKAWPFQIEGGKAAYSMTVVPKNGDVRIGVVRRGPKDKITPEIIKTWELTPAAKGESKVLEGTLESGQYSFVIVTDSKIMITGSLKAKVN